jgi:DNA-binding SARP family transcriptional activator
MEFRILGPLEVGEGDRLVALGGAKPRALLALLLLLPNEVVPRERLVEELWGDPVPASAGKVVQVYVSRLRKAMGADAPLVTRAGGYVLELADAQLDLHRFERLVAEGRRALDDDEPRRAERRLAEALALWRGPPLVDFSYEPFAQSEIARLEELRLAALEDRIEAELALGRHARLVGELESLVAEHPLRERIRGQLMRALYGCGRQADALEAYRQGRRRLVDELGLEPGPALRELERAILEQSAELGAATQPMPLTRPVLPAPPNRTIGREQDVRMVVEQLRSGTGRLVTLTGPGGVGKTRLALEAARAVEADFADGARFVSLAAVQRPEDVPTAVVKSLEVVLLPGESTERAVARFLEPKHLLLVVDNCEHLLGAAPLIGGLPAACPSVTVLATSREPLAVQAEQCCPVSPLAGENAVALFCERARAHDPAFEIDNGNAAAVEEICDRVDGLPLAIELAAARCALLSPREIDATAARARRAGCGRTRRPGTAADVARDDRLEPRAARRGRTAVLRPVRGVQRRRDRGGG